VAYRKGQVLAGLIEQRLCQRMDDATHQAFTLQVTAIPAGGLQLVFRQSMVRFFKVFLAVLLTLVLLFVALPALLQIADLPSFRLGDGLFLVVDWRNDAKGNRIMFGVLPLGILALAIALIDQWAIARNRP
jgi:hypothetical protein